MVMRLNPTELCSYAIAALIVIATITRGDLDRDDRVVISALVRDNECGGERRNHTPLADWCPHGKSVSLPLAGAR